MRRAGRLYSYEIDFSHAIYIYKQMCHCASPRIITKEGPDVFLSIYQLKGVRTLLAMT